jgi:hypothetical protein
MRLPGAVGIDFRDRRGVRRRASEILTSLMLVYVANLGMDYVVCGPGAIAGPATHRSSSSAMSRARLERLIEQRAPRTEIKSLAMPQGIMLRRVPRYARSIGAMKAANSIVADRKRTKTSQMPKIVNLVLQGEALHFEGIAGMSAGAVDAVVLADGLAAGGREGGCGTASLPENSRAGHFLPIDPQCPWATRSAVICRGCGTRKRPGINPGPSSFRLRVA